MSTNLTKTKENFLDQIFSDFDSIFQPTTFDQIVNKWFNESNPNFKKLGFKITGSSNPKLNILEYADRYEVVADIGALQKEDIKLSVEENSDVFVLSILSDKKLKLDKNGEKFNYIYRELSSNHSNMCRVIYFNIDNIDTKSVTAEFESGLLRISISKKTVNKKQEVISKQIEIK